MHLPRPSSYVKTDDYIQILYYNPCPLNVRITFCRLLHLALKGICALSLFESYWSVFLKSPKKLVHIPQIPVTISFNNPLSFQCSENVGIVIFDLNIVRPL